MISPTQNIIDTQGYLLLDGGLATEMEKQGLDLNHNLWSAYHIERNPEVIRSVHHAFLEAGADCIATVSYQASYEGGTANGMTDRQIEQWMMSSVNLACEARDTYYEKNEKGILCKPLVGASIGPYGAYLANGAEYYGNYAVSAQVLYDFHARRWELFAGSEADIMICETFPSFEEAKVIVRLFEQTPEKEGYISFTCRDKSHISDGTPLIDCVQLLNEQSNVRAIGVNCMAISMVDDLIITLKSVPSELEIAVYPNSGEIFDPQTKEWSGNWEITNFGLAVEEWYKLGARIIGGCCRTTPEHIREARYKLDEMIPSKMSQATG